MIARNRDAPSGKPREHVMKPVFDVSERLVEPIQAVGDRRNDGTQGIGDIAQRSSAMGRGDRGQRIDSISEASFGDDPTAVQAAHAVGDEMDAGCRRHRLQLCPDGIQETPAPDWSAFRNRHLRSNDRQREIISLSIPPFKERPEPGIVFLSHIASCGLASPTKDPMGQH